MCFSFIWQSKFKKDTSTTSPILLNKPKAKVHSFPLFAFPYLCMHPIITFFFFGSVHPSPYFNVFLLGRPQAHFCLPSYKWGGSCYYCYADGGLLWWYECQYRGCGFCHCYYYPRSSCWALGSFTWVFFCRGGPVGELSLGSPPSFLLKSLLPKREPLPQGHPRPKALLLLFHRLWRIGLH